MQKRIHITELSFPCITRRRGQEAGEKLQEYLEAEPVEIDLDGVEMLSLSFLDGLVSQLLVFGNTERVTFRVGDSIVKDKLARVAAIRHATLFYQSGNRQGRQVLPSLVLSYKAAFMPAKTPLYREVQNVMLIMSRFLRMAHYIW